MLGIPSQESLNEVRIPIAWEGTFAKWAQEPASQLALMIPNIGELATPYAYREHPRCVAVRISSRDCLAFPRSDLQGFWIWDKASGQEVWNHRTTTFFSHLLGGNGKQHGIVQMIEVPLKGESSLLATTLYNGEITLWDLEKQVAIETWQAKSSETLGTGAVLRSLDDHLLISRHKHQFEVYKVQAATPSYKVELITSLRVDARVERFFPIALPPRCEIFDGICFASVSSDATRIWHLTSKTVSLREIRVPGRHSLRTINFIQDRPEALVEKRWDSIHVWDSFARSEELVLKPTEGRSIHEMDIFSSSRETLIAWTEGIVKKSVFKDRGLSVYSLRSKKSGRFKFERSHLLLGEGKSLAVPLEVTHTNRMHKIQLIGGESRIFLLLESLVRRRRSYKMLEVVEREDSFDFQACGEVLSNAPRLHLVNRPGDSPEFISFSKSEAQLLKVSEEI